MVILLVGLAGCYAPPAEPTESDADEEKATFTFVKSRLPSPQTDRTPSVELLIQRIDLPIENDLEPAWSFVESTGLDESSIDLWRNNGLRVGTLNDRNRQKFIENLKSPKTNWSVRMTLGTYEETLLLSSPLREPARFHLNLPDGTAESVTCESGTLRFLLRVYAVSENMSVLQIIPQHHQPRVTIMFRDLRDKILDGRVFNELAIDLPLPTISPIVIGIAEPPAPAIPAVPTSQPNGSLAPAEENTPTEPDAPVRPTIGARLLTSTNYGKPTKIILIIWGQLSRTTE
jgi:hypothetical protein